jgi:hypothetical protein
LKKSLNLRQILGIMAKKHKYSLRAGKSAALTGLSWMANSSQPSPARLIFQICRPIFAMRLAWKRGFALKTVVMRCLKLRSGCHMAKTLYFGVTSSSYPSQNVARMAQRMEKLPAERSND